MQDLEKVNALELLKQEIEDIFGRPITSYRECVLLGDEIYRKTSFLVSHNTLRRFFGLVKANYPPSTSTISILAKYCGFSSLKEMVVKKKKLLLLEHNNPGYNIPEYMISLMRDTPVKEPYDATFAALTKQTIHFLQDYPKLAFILQKEIAKTKNGQDYYFEQFINVNALNSYYGEGLCYYVNEKRTEKSQIFGHSLLCLRAWLTGNTTEVKRHYEEIVKQRVLKYLTPVTSYLYYVSLLLYADVEGLNTDNVLQDAYQIESKYFAGKNPEYLWAEYLFGITLLLTGKYSELLYFFSIADIYGKKQSAVIDNGFFEVCAVLRAIALAKTGNVEQAKKLYGKVRPSHFYFLTKKLDTILYIMLARLLHKVNDKMEDLLKRMIEDTGFTMLQLIKRNLLRQGSYMPEPDEAKWASL